MAKAPVLFRSQFERKIREWLEVHGFRFEYENRQFPITVNVAGHYCRLCGAKNISRDTTYTPDFYLPRSLVVLEAKGKFDARARRIALAMKEQYPHIDYRILLQRDNWLTGKKKQRYSDWLTKHNIPFAVGPYPPKEWCGTPGSSGRASGASSKAGSSTNRGKQRRKS